MDLDSLSERDLSPIELKTFKNDFPLSERRRRLLSELNQVSKSSEISTKILVHVYAGILEVAGPHLLPKEDIAMLDVQNIKRKMLKIFSQNAAQDMIETLHYVYREADEKQL